MTAAAAAAMRKGAPQRMEAQMQRQVQPLRSCGGCWPRGQRMSWRIYNSLRRTEDQLPGLQGCLQHPHLASSRPGACSCPEALGSAPIWGKDSRWWMGLYFYNIKDQKVPIAVLIAGEGAFGTACTVEPAHCCTPGWRVPVREAENLTAVSVPEGARGTARASELLVFGLSAVPRFGSPGHVHQALPSSPRSLETRSFSLKSNVFLLKVLCVCLLPRPKENKLWGRSLCIAAAALRG